MAPNRQKIQDIAKLEASIRSAMIRISDDKRNSNSPYPIHLALGHERLAATCSVVASEHDQFVLTHRNIHFNLALTSKDSWDEIKNEAMCLETGINKGAYGCMTMRAGQRVAYSSSILGNHLSVGLGVASTMPASNVCWLQIGDGAIEEGAFHEALVLSNAIDLNCIYLVENNNWSLGTSISERRKSIDLEMMARAHGVKYWKIKIDETIEGYLKILDSARKCRSGPAIVEVILQTEGGKHDTLRVYTSYHHGSLSL